MIIHFQTQRREDVNYDGWFERQYETLIVHCCLSHKCLYIFVVVVQATILAQTAVWKIINGHRSSPFTRQSSLRTCVRAEGRKHKELIVRRTNLLVSNFLVSHYWWTFELPCRDRHTKGILWRLPGTFELFSQCSSNYDHSSVQRAEIAFTIERRRAILPQTPGNICGRSLSGSEIARTRQARDCVLSRQTSAE